MRFPRFRRTPRDAGAAALRRYELEPAPACLFERPPANLGGGTLIVVGDVARSRATRREYLTLRGAEVPALTITSDPHNLITVVGTDGPDSTMGFCAYAEGENESEARERLQHMSMTRRGSTVSLNGRGLFDGQKTSGSLDVEGPADASVVILASYAALEVRNMRGPVRIATTHARATVLGTTGQVDAIGLEVDFAGSRGRVTLSADHDINIKMTGSWFEGALLAQARRSVRMLVPPEFVTPFEAVVRQPEDCVCRASLCSEVDMKRQGTLCVFTTPAAGGSDADRFCGCNRSRQPLTLRN